MVAKRKQFDQGAVIVLATIPYLRKTMAIEEFLFQKGHLLIFVNVLLDLVLHWVIAEVARGIRQSLFGFL